MLTKHSIKRPFTVIVMLIVIAIIGGVAVVKMPLDLFPDMELPYMIVATMVPGAAPEEVEKKVTVPMEESMRQINNVKEVQSISADSVSAVIMALNNGTDLTTMTQDIDTGIKAIKGQFPEMTMEPIIMKVDPDMMPIMTVAISQNGKTIEESSSELLEVADKIKSVGGVASVSSTGQIESKAFIQVDAERILKDPSNMLVNHLSAYLSNPLKPMPERLDTFIKDAKINFKGIEMGMSGIIDMLRNSPRVVSDMLKGQIDLTGIDIINQNKDVFLSSFSSMLSPEMISMMLTANNFEVPAGTETVKGVDFIVKVGEKFSKFADLEHMPAFSLDLRELKMPNASFDPSQPESPSNQKDLLAMDLIRPIIDGLVKATLTAEEMDATISKLVGNAPVLPPNPTPEQQAKYEKDKASYDTNLATITSLLGNVLYTKSGDTYNRNADVYSYILGLLYQPITVELSDFAYVYNTNTASKAHTIINGADGMMLSIYKTPDASVTNVTNGISKLLKDMHTNNEEFNYIVLSNQGEVTKFMISSIAQNLLLGALFAILVLLIFLRDWKPTLTVGMSILVSLVTAFAVMYLCGVTLNLVSMGGLALSVGMLVDNSIVVIENIYRKRNEGVSPIKAAYEGTKQVAGAIMSSTITTVIVFLPIMFVEGITRQIFTDLAITIAVSLFASLLVAITFVPMISSRMVNLNKASRHEAKSFTAFKKGYTKALNFMLDKKWITVSVVTVLFIGSIVAMFFMDTEFLPDTTMDQIMVSTGIRQSELDENYSYDEVIDDVIKDINRELDKKDYIESRGVELSAGMSVMGFTMGGGNIVTYVTLKDKAKIKPKEATADLEQMIVDIAEKYPKDLVVPGGIKNNSGVDVQSMVNNYLDSSLLTVNVYGQDIDEMIDAAKKLEADLNNDLQPLDKDVFVNCALQDTTQFKLIIDETKASKYNLTTAQIFLQYFQATVPETANSTINFTGDIGNSNIYIYTTDNNMDRWYRPVGNDGKHHRLYFDKSESTASASKFYERVDDNRSHDILFTKTKRGEMTYFESEDGSKTYSVPTADNPVYFDNSKIKNTDMITQPITVPAFGEMPDMDSGMMPMAEQNGDLAQKDVLPIFMLLDERSFEIDTLGNVKYRNTSDPTSDPRFANYDRAHYYEDKDHFIRYNYTGDDIEVLKTLDPAKDINPKVPVGIRQVSGFNTISHMEGKRVIQLGVKSEVLSNKQLEKAIRDTLKNFNDRTDISAKVSAEYVGANEVITETFNGLFLMIGMAIVFIYLVMVAQFQSLKSPFIIMFTIPLALTGSILTLLMAGMPISVFALTGIILLVGIVVNNGIVFVDYANKLREGGMPKREALLKTAQDRIRPILMTALTTICSMLISVFDTSMGASAIKPMAVTVVGGLTYATLLTLFFVPILYDAFNRKEKLAVIKFDDDKEEDIEAEMRLTKLNDVKEALEESNTLSMMDEGYIANNMPTETPMETYINETTGEDIVKETAPTEEPPVDEIVAEEPTTPTDADVVEDVTDTDVVLNEDEPKEEEPKED